ncbi:hypothetical protein SAMN04489724_2672 [Algoriphagus locisalis]|uniref:DUF3052 domain-containing protein n=1 Tax=Algoriphagus locisalis TaxID=305507 RepID=A0A1I7BSR7_9BACT|nr:hypothetical protein [Algoriphagus locisalis]SFT90238.1 hypothetical protein SAMN04489724_2672 [Algoriphagus locisalis]
MDPLLKKMTWKKGMNIQVWNCPTDLEQLINAWKKDGLILPAVKPDFLLAFVQSEDEVKNYFTEMQALAQEDEQIWLAYPKGTSKRYKAKINRDSGWKYLGEFDYEGVRQVAINEDWSALRFRNTKYVKVMTRKFSVKDQK